MAVRSTLALLAQRFILEIIMEPETFHLAYCRLLLEVLPPVPGNNTKTTKLDGTEKELGVVLTEIS
jgi:hypothetical protein